MSRILVAEDDRFLGNAYRVKLTKEGFEVKIVPDGEEALALMPEFLPDVVILDLVMPHKDGFGVLADMKKRNELKNIPVIVASNLGQKEDLDRAKAMGANDYVVKSDLSMSDLILKINTLLSQAKKV